MLELLSVPLVLNYGAFPSTRYSKTLFQSLEIPQSTFLALHKIRRSSDYEAPGIAKCSVGPDNRRMKGLTVYYSESPSLQTAKCIVYLVQGLHEDCLNYLSARYSATFFSSKD